MKAMSSINEKATVGAQWLVLSVVVSEGVIVTQ